MGLLSSLFPGVSGALVQTDRLGSGGDPTLIQGDDKGAIVKYSSLPAKTNPQAVITASEESGKSEAQTYLLRQLSRHTLRTAENALAALETRVEHSNQMQGIENKFQRLQAKHGKNLMRYGLGVAENKANYSGYESEFQAAQGIIDI